MPFEKCKVYSDGSHYIAIPHTTRPYRPRPQRKEEVIPVQASPPQEYEPRTDDQKSDATDNSGTQHPIKSEIIDLQEQTNTLTSDSTPSPTRYMTRKELFDEAYSACQSVTKKQRRRYLFETLRPYFDTDLKTNDFISLNLQRKLRNLISRRIRMTRKANLQDFNYFVTFTYSDGLHSEESFKKGLKNCLKNFSNRKKWKYMGVWERSPKKQRLHFHGIFYIPPGTLPGELLPFRDYNTTTHSMQTTWQSLYFNERFGRSDFKEIDDPSMMGPAMAYLMKYIEKSGEKIVYSKGLPQFFISDIMDEDVICPFGLEDKKLLLSDTFRCWNEGEFIGTVSQETIARMPKSN